MTRLSPDDFSTFIRLWDGHRAAVNIWLDGVMLNVASLVVASVWLLMVRLKPDTHRLELSGLRRRLLLLRITAAGSLLALAMIPLSWIPPERLPAALLVLMPGPLPELRRDDVRRAAHRASRQPPRALEPPRAAVPDVRPARSRSQHAVGVPRAPSPRPAIRATSGRLHDRVASRRPRCSPARRGQRVRRVQRRARHDAQHRRTHCTRCTCCTCRTCRCSPSSC